MTVKYGTVSNAYKTKLTLDSRPRRTIVRLKMGGRKPKVIELDSGDLINKSVSQIDSELAAIFAYATMALALRRHKAAIEKIDTPPPVPPVDLAPEDSRRQSVQNFSTEVRINGPRRTPNTLPDKPPKHITFVAGSTVHTAYQIIDRYPHGVDLPVFREEFERVYTGEDAMGHTRALSRLRESRHVIPYKKRIFTYDRLKKFLEDVEAGVVSDMPDEQPTLRGKWAVGVYEFLRSRNGEWVKYSEIVDHIAHLPEFENAANVGSQVAVALRGLQYRHNSIEKEKGRGKSQYRIKLEGFEETNTSPPQSAAVN